MMSLEQIGNLRNLVRSIPVIFNIEVANHWGNNKEYLSSESYTYYHLLFVKKGTLSLSFVCDDGISKVELSDGHIMVISPDNLLTGVLSDLNAEFYGVDFFLLETKTGVPYSTGMSLMLDAPVQKGIYYEALFSRLKTLFELNQHPLERHLAGSLLHFILGEFYSQIKHPWENQFENKAIENLCAKINANPIWSPDLQELSEQMNLSKFHFSRIFKKNTGYSPKQYIIQVRLRYARRMLLEKRCSVKVAAELSGYPDIYSFSKQFKKFFGYPPSKIEIDNI